MFCTNCSAQMPNDVNFCGQCGCTLNFNSQAGQSQPQQSQAQVADNSNPYIAGSIVQFGRYPTTIQSCFTPEGEPIPSIAWIVLDFNPTTREAFLLSQNIVDCKMYNRKTKSVSWCDSEIRRWLNTEFYNSAFNQAEQSQILNTTCSGNGIESRNDLPITDDFVFLLNSLEASNLGSDANRQAIGTAFAKQEKRIDKCSLWEYGFGGKSRWWLRNRGKGGNSCAAYVNDSGSIYTHGHDVHEVHYGVRPSIRIKV